MITVEDDAIVAAMRLIWERMKLVVEPSAAVPLAVALSPTFKALENIETVGLFVSAGNLDLAKLPF